MKVKRFLQSFYPCILRDHQNKCVCMLIAFNATFNNISVISWRSVLLVEETTGARGTKLPPPFFNFLFAYLFSIKLLYFFIISFLLPYFNLFVSIFMQSYVNSNLHVSILYTNYPRSINLTAAICFIPVLYAIINICIIFLI